ncbi:rRNA biogenesis protein rrp36 [Aphanomyces cochlioides]|nr:rRNA biogenesis protein rrp36 [Aphanomyces cochlioides]
MVRSDVRDLTLEERLKLKKNGFAETPRQRDDSSDDDDQDHDTGDEEDEGQPSKKRANKNRPREMTSKRPVGRFREVLQVRKKATRDPRFDNASGKLNDDLFKKSYAFLEEYKEAELDDVKKQLKKAKSATRKAELQQELSKRKQELAEAKRADRIREATLKRKREERQAVENGKGAFYLKHKDKKQLELKAKYDELAESGRLSKFMAKRRKKNANKDHRWLPTQRKT